MDALQEKITKEGLSVVRLDHPSGSKCLATLFGGHVVSFQDSNGKEYLFLSSKAILTGKKAIRGGVPVIFPQFGPGKLPQHGFARTSTWTLAQPPVFNATTNTTTAILTLKDTNDTYSVWPHHFELKLSLELHPAKLVMELSCSNTDTAPFEFTSALHTYFSVPDVRHVTIRGKDLERCEFVAYEDVGDGIPPGTVRKQGKDEIVFAGYLDRSYFDGPALMRIVDEEEEEEGGPSSKVVVVVEAVKSSGFRDCVVWNPWKEKADAMSDMGVDEWMRFVCVEAAVVRVPVRLDPGMSWAASQTVSGAVLPPPKL